MYRVLLCLVLVCVMASMAYAGPIRNLFQTPGLDSPCASGNCPGNVCPTPAVTVPVAPKIHVRVEAKVVEKAVVKQKAVAVEETAAESGRVRVVLRNIRERVKDIFRRR